MFHDTNIIQRTTIGRCSTYGEFFESKLCNMEIIGTNQLKKHLAGKRHIRNKTKDDTNVSICDSSFEEELTEVQVDVINEVEKAMTS